MYFPLHVRSSLQSLVSASSNNPILRLFIRNVPITRYMSGLQCTNYVGYRYLYQLRSVYLKLYQLRGVLRNRECTNYTGHLRFLLCVAGYLSDVPSSWDIFLTFFDYNVPITRYIWRHFRFFFGFNGCTIYVGCGIGINEPPSWVM